MVLRSTYGIYKPAQENLVKKCHPRAKGLRVIFFHTIFEGRFIYHIDRKTMLYTI